MKHAIIPTDFSIRSLQPVHDVIHYYRGRQVKITLLHLVDMPNGIGDLLLRLRRTEDKFEIPKEFRHACEMIANRYETQLASIMPIIQYGTTRFYLENLLEGMNVDAVFLQSGYQFTMPFKESIDMPSLLKRCDCNLIETSPVRKPENTRVSTLSDLLLAGS